MSASTTNRETERQVAAKPDNDQVRRPLSIVSLAVLLLLLAIGALQGGIAMVTNPDDPLGMSPTYLEGTAVADYFWPGIFLLGIAVASLVTAIGLFIAWNWSWARPIEEFVGFSWPWLGAVSTGTILLAFEIIELFLVPFHPVMHPLLIAGSVAILILPNLASGRAFLAVERGE